MFLGISDAVFIFTAIVKPVRCHVASLGIPILVYIDDGLTGGASEKEASKNNEISNEIFAKAGWVISKDKGKGPSQRILFLGLEFCSVKLMFFIPEKKIVKLLSAMDSLLSRKKVKLRELASILGLLQSCARALGPVVRLRTKCSYLFLMFNVNQFSWNYFMALSDDVVEELNFWVHNLLSLNGFKINTCLSMIDFHLDVIADASEIGIFGYKLSSTEYEIRGYSLKGE